MHRNGMEDGVSPECDGDGKGLIRVLAEHMWDRLTT